MQATDFAMNLESSPSGDIESVTLPRTTESPTHGVESGTAMLGNGTETSRRRSVTTTVSLEQHSTGLSRDDNRQSVVADGTNTGPVTLRNLPGFQSGGVGRRRHTEDPAARATLSAFSGMVPRVVDPTLRVNQTGCGQPGTGATNNSRGIHELANWFQEEYARSNSQIMAERDAWACELRRNTGEERRVEPDEESSEG